VAQIGRDCRLPREVDVPRARAEVEHEIRQAHRRAELGALRQHPTRRDRARAARVDVDRDRGEKGAAKMLGLNATTLEARIKKMGIKRDA